jgi:hypothetical protein
MIGRNLKQYLVEEKLGQGGMGVVYRARDTSLNRPVALKVLSPDLVRDEERRRRFVQEARAASAVNHPSIAQIYEIVEEGDPTFIVMEYVDGATRRELVARRELDITSAIEVGIQVGEALAGPTRAGSFTATSSPTTSWSPATATRRSSTSGWRSCSTRGRVGRPPASAAWRPWLAPGRE